MSKSTKILIGVLVILAAIYFIQRLTSRTSTMVQTHPFSKIDTANVSEFTIRNGRDIVLDRERGEWVVTSPVRCRADRGEVGMLLTGIASNPEASAVTDNLQDTTAYGIGSDSPSLTIRTGDGKEINLAIGNVTPDFGGCYIRFPGDDQILELSRNMRSIVGENLTGWRDKKIFDFDASDVKSMKIAVGDTNYNFERGDTVWLVNGSVVPMVTGEGIVQSLTGTYAIDFIDSAESAGNSSITYSLTLSDGIVNAGKIFKVAEQVCLTNSATGQIYVVSSVVPDNLRSELRSLRTTYLARERS